MVPSLLLAVHGFASSRLPSRGLTLLENVACYCIVYFSRDTPEHCLVHGGIPLFFVEKATCFKWLQNGDLLRSFEGKEFLCSPFVGFGNFKTPALSRFPGFFSFFCICLKHICWGVTRNWVLSEGLETSKIPIRVRFPFGFGTPKHKMSSMLGVPTCGDKQTHVRLYSRNMCGGFGSASSTNHIPRRTKTGPPSPGPQNRTWQFPSKGC